MQDFLFELGCEELPSAAVKKLSNALKDGLTAELEKQQLTYETIDVFATPRRLGILIKALVDKQPTQTTQKRGPAVAAAYDESGNPSKALIGFARSCGVDADALETLQTDKGSWLVHNQVLEGRAVVDLLPDLIEGVLTQLPIAKLMRWGNGDIAFVRPVHWLLMMYGDSVVPANILGLQSDRLSFGHRFHAPDAIVIESPQTYEDQLRQAFVMADFIARMKSICEQIEQLAAKHQATPVMPQALVEEVTSIVEWPVALAASFDAQLLNVPPEALIASMQAHQKCFALQSENGQLINQFITIANIDSTNPAQVIAGNEKVMRARLKDAAFFFEQDSHHALHTLIDKTKQVVFQQQMGSLKDKTDRMAQWVQPFAIKLGLDLPEVERAVVLSKCDLLTGMVGEFPELQGLMGYYYAKKDGESHDVAVALQEQYYPRFAADKLPESKAGWLLSMADRIDTLVGIFMQGKKPTGMKDPFKCRRHALAIARMLLPHPTQFTLSEMIERSQALFATQIETKSSQVDQLKPFILDRLHSHLLAQQIPHQVIDAVLAAGNEDIYDIGKRVKALAAFVKTDACQSLASACKRVGNILRQADVEPDTVDEQHLIEPAEISLWERLLTTQQQCQQTFASQQYESALSQLATLKEPVDSFFDQVMVMAEDTSVRHNRLALLKQLQQMLQQVADISLLSSV